jgi:hypothetical protein
VNWAMFCIGERGFLLCSVGKKTLVVVCVVIFAAWSALRGCCCFGTTFERVMSLQMKLGTDRTVPMVHGSMVAQ